MQTLPLTQIALLKQFNLAFFNFFQFSFSRAMQAYACVAHSFLSNFYYKLSIKSSVGQQQLSFSYFTQSVTVGCKATGIK